MASTFVAAGTASSGTADPASLTPALPAGIASGDLLFYVCGTGSGDIAPAHSVAAGWTELGEQGSGLSAASLGYRIATGSDSAPVISFSGGSVYSARAQVFAYRGNRNESPFASGADGVNTGGSSTHSKAAETSTEADVTFIYADWCAANTALGQETDWTEDSDTGGTGGRISIGHRDIATSATSSGAISETGGNDQWVMWMFQVRTASINKGAAVHHWLQVMGAR